MNKVIGYLTHVIDSCNSLTRYLLLNQLIRHVYGYDFSVYFEVVLFILPGVLMDKRIHIL